MQNDEIDVDDRSVSLRQRMKRRQRLLLRVAGEQGWKCCGCGGDTIMPPLMQHGKVDQRWATLERVLPGAFGGTYAYTNVVMYCFKCNNKGASKITKHINQIIRRLQGGKPNRLKGDKQREMIAQALLDGVVDLTEYDFGQISYLRASPSSPAQSACQPDRACDPQADRCDTDALPASPSPC